MILVFGGATALSEPSARVPASVGRDAVVQDLHERRLEEQVTEIEQRVALGQATQTDLAQVRSRLARAQALRAAARGNLRKNRARYEAIIGAPPSGASN